MTRTDEKEGEGSVLMFLKLGLKIKITLLAFLKIGRWSPLLSKKPLNSMHH